MLAVPLLAAAALGSPDVDHHLKGIRFGEAAVAAARSPDTVMKLHMMSDKGLKHNGAVCLDGTDAGFYYAPASDASKNASWQLYFQGGGWCYDKVDCFGRSNSRLGSSKTWSPTVSAGGIMSDNCDVNPDFCNFHRVYMPYCDGDSFSGNREEAVVVKGKPLYFRGHRVLRAVLDTLVRDHGLGTAKEVLLTGCSAGGLSTFRHADYVHATVKAAAPGLQTFKAAPISGFFLDHDTVDGQRVYAAEMANIFNLANSSGGVNAACIAATPRSEAWRCNFAEKAYEFTSTPIMPLNSAADCWQTSCILTSSLPAAFPNQTDIGNGVCTSAPGWQNCSCYGCDVEKCTSKQVATLNGYIGDFGAIMEHKATYTKPGNGAFIHSCHTHCEAQDDHAYTTFAVGGVTIQQAVSKWWASSLDTPAPANSYQACTYSTKSPYKCNPTC